MLQLPYKICTPKKEDIPQLLILFKEQYDYHHLLDPQYYVCYSDCLRTTIESHLNKLLQHAEPEIRVAKNEIELVGFITFSIETEEYMDTVITKYGEIKELFVTLAHRRKKIGTALVNAAEDYFRAKKLLYSSIRYSAKNSAAPSVYKTQGYLSHQTILYKELK